MSKQKLPITENVRIPKTIPGLPARRLRLPISLVLILGFGGLVLLGTASVFGLGIVTASKNTFTLLQDKASLRLDIIETRIHDVLNPAEALAADLTGMIATRKLDPNQPKQLVNTLRGALSGLLQVTGLYFSAANAQTVAVGRWSGSEIEVRLNHNSDLELIQAATGLREATAPYWQDIVWLQELEHPALNLNVPIWQEDTFVGALIIVVSLDRLGHFIANLREPQADGNAFILLGREHVLAHPAMIDGSWRDHLSNDGPPLPRREQLNDPVLKLLGQDQIDHVLTTDHPPPHITPLPEHETQYLVFGRLLEDYGQQPWIIGQSYAIEAVGLEVRRLFRTGFVSVVILIVAVLVALLLGRQITRRIRQLALATESVRTLNFADVPVLPDSRFRELANAGYAFNAMVAALKWFEMYVPKSLVLRLMRHDRDTIVTSQERQVTVMFTDIQGFSTLAQRLSANQVAELLNEHFALLADCIEAEGGTVDKYIGDSVMAFWGAPDEQPDQAERAIRTARAIMAALTQDNTRRRAAGNIVIRLRIGINTGSAVVGNIGSASRINYTLVGDTVNIAQRLEGLAKQYHGDEDVIVLVSASTADADSSDSEFIALGGQALPGLEGQMQVFRFIPQL